MKTVQLYGLKNCSTCVKAMRWLEQQGVDFSFTDYRDNPVAPQALSAWAQELGGWEKLVNRASMTWRNLPQESKRSEEHTSELQSLMRISYAVFCLKKKNTKLIVRQT